MPTAANKGVYIPTAKRKVLGMFPSSGSGKLIFLYDEQQKKYLLAQCERLMGASHWHEDVERITPGEWLEQFFLLIFDYRTALLTFAYHCNLHHIGPKGFRWFFAFASAEWKDVSWHFSFKLVLFINLITYTALEYICTELIYLLSTRYKRLTHWQKCRLTSCSNNLYNCNFRRPNYKCIFSIVVTI